MEGIAKLAIIFLIGAFVLIHIVWIISLIILTYSWLKVKKSRRQDTWWQDVFIDNELTSMVGSIWFALIGFTVSLAIGLLIYAKYKS